MRLLLSLVLIICYSSSIFAEATPLNAEHLFTEPKNEMAALSPYGRFISMHQIKRKTHYLSLFDSQTLELKRLLTLGNDNILNDYYWLNANQLLLDIVYKGNPAYLIANIDEGGIKAKFVKSKGYLVSILPSKENEVLFAKRKKRNLGYELYVIDIDSLREGDFSNALLVDRLKGNVNRYFFDAKTQRVIASDFDEQSNLLNIRYLSLLESEWQPIMSLKASEYQMLPLDFINQNLIAVLTNKGTDKVVLRSYDIQTQTLGEIIYQHPKYDLISADFTEGGELKYVVFKQHGLNKKLYFDLGVSEFQKRLTNTLDGQEVFVIDHAEQKNLSLLYANGSNEPGLYFIYNHLQDEIIKFLPSHPNLLEETFVKTKQFTVKTSENFEIEAFLTQPTKTDHSTLLIMPHGGPIGIQESDRFNRTVQYYVSRGFSVLRVNFRGSSGFGKTFLEKGVGEFGQKIEQDIMAAVAKTKEEHHFEHQCSIGASYGAYSALMLAIRHPQDFDCVVSAFGVYDLSLLFNASNYRSGEEYQRFIEKTVGSYKHDLKSISPLYLSERLTQPLLIIAGKEDDIADFEHSNRLKYILKKRNYDFETMFYEGTGHGHNTWQGDIHEVAVSYDFLMRVLKLKEPKPIALDDKSRRAIANDYAAIADGFYSSSFVVEDKAQALKYYLKAARYDHAQANYMLGNYYFTGKHVALDRDKAILYYQNAAELGFFGAHSKLGLMYMHGDYLKQNWDLAFEHLTQAYNLEESPINRIRLARFYCLAPKVLQDVDECLRLMEITQYEKVSSTELAIAELFIKETLSWAFATAELSNSELKKLRSFAMNVFQLKSIDVDLEDMRAGFFEFKENERFGRAGEYELFKSNTELPDASGEKSYFGAIFNVDIPGINENTHRTAIAVKWTQFSLKDEKLQSMSRIIVGSPRQNWHLLRNLSELNASTKWTLEVYDFEQNLLFKKDFNY